MRQSLRAGVALAEITPPPGRQLEGHQRCDDGALGTHDPLLTSALVLDDGSHRAALIAHDLVGLPGREVTQANRQIHALTGLPPAAVLHAASHTHGGPCMLGMMDLADQEFRQQWLAAVPGVVARAAGSLEPVELSLAFGEEGTAAHNRRLVMRDGSIRMSWETVPADQVMGTDGPIDPVVTLLTARRPDGSAIANLLHYTLHAAVMDGTNRYYTADWPGAAKRRIEAERGGISLFMNGACGNINHLGINSVPDTGFPLVEEIGERIAEAALAAEPAGLPGGISFGARELCLPRREIPDSVIERSRGIAASQIAREPLPNGMSEDDYARQVLRVAAEGTEPVRTWIQAIAIGELALMAWPAEVFVEFGLELRRRSPFRHTLVVSYANDYLGYIPTREAFARGGYEPILGIASKLREDAGEQLLEQSLELLNEIKGT